MTHWYHLGRTEYLDGLELQRQFVASRRAEKSPDTLLLLEHPPVLTLGRGATRANVLHSTESLEQQGVSLFETDRGGDVTYHGPGQLVGYPLLFLPPGRQDVRRYVRLLEEVIIQTLRDFGLAATRIERWPGVFIEESRSGGPKKICALGVHLSRWYTRHGFALNVDPNLDHFGLIVPCGIREAGVTSMRAELGRPVPMSEVEGLLVARFGEVFETVMEPRAPDLRAVSVIVRGVGESVLLLKRTLGRGGFWQPVTGRVEGEETAQAAARRELFEETGLAASPTALDYEHAFALGDEAPPCVATESCFSVQVDQDFIPALDEDEHEAFEWVSRADALSRIPYEGLRMAVKLAFKGG
jgi:lipoyl(octanoyl) transferase